MVANTQDGEHAFKHRFQKGALEGHPFDIFGFFADFVEDAEGVDACAGPSV
jgi:hypothetical protein